MFKSCIFLLISLGVSAQVWSANQILHQTFLDLNSASLEKQFQSWFSTDIRNLGGSWRLVLSTIKDDAREDLRSIFTEDDRLMEYGIRNPMDGSEYKLLSIDSVPASSCSGQPQIVIQNIVYEGLNQGPHCLSFRADEGFFSFREYGINPFLNWKTDAWTSYQCRSQKKSEEIFLLCKISISGDWFTADPSWNEKISKWLDRPYGFLGFIKKTDSVPVVPQE